MRKDKYPIREMTHQNIKSDEGKMNFIKVESDSYKVIYPNINKSEKQFTFVVDWQMGYNSHGEN